MQLSVVLSPPSARIEERDSGNTRALPMVECKRCFATMREVTGILSTGAIQVLVKRERPPQQIVGETEWRDGPLCNTCLAAWSALIHALEQENHRR